MQRCTYLYIYMYLYTYNVYISICIYKYLYTYNVYINKYIYIYMCVCFKLSCAFSLNSKDTLCDCCKFQFWNPKQYQSLKAQPANELHWYMYTCDLQQLRNDTWWEIAACTFLWTLGCSALEKSQDLHLNSWSKYQNCVATNRMH